MNTQIESRVASCISVALSLCDEPRFVAWAADWSSSTDRSARSIAQLASAIEDEAGLSGWWLYSASDVSALDAEDRGLFAALVALSAAESALWSVRMSAEDPAGIKYAWQDAAVSCVKRLAAIAAL